MWPNFQSNYLQNPQFRSVYDQTQVLRRPLCGIVSGYHELPYILITPDDDDPSHSVEINGKVNVSPKFIISPGALSETFGEVFDPETFDRQIEGRFFSFACGRRKDVQVKSEYLHIKNIQEKVQEYLDKVHDKLMLEENIRTSLLFGPVFQYYPISIDRFISEIVEREFNL